MALKIVLQAAQSPKEPFQEPLTDRWKNEVNCILVPWSYINLTYRSYCTYDTLASRRRYDKYHWLQLSVLWNDLFELFKMSVALPTRWETYLRVLYSQKRGFLRVTTRCIVTLKALNKMNPIFAISKMWNCFQFEKKNIWAYIFAKKTRPNNS